MIAQVLERVRQVQDAVRSEIHVKVAGGGTKPALSSAATLSLTDLSGVLEYDPQEYTFTALAGTPLREVAELLGGEGQYLPFDPPLVDSGATLGGTVAAGLSGAGRFRYGGVRDFLLGVKFIDGTGELRSGGGKVVKNAAGFDFPKLMVGSLGRFGVMTELTFKVFPRPEAYASLQLDAPSFAEAANAMHRLASSGLELSCVDLLPQGRLELRFGGAHAAQEVRLGRVQAFMGLTGESLTGEADAALWSAAAEFDWLPAGHSLLKVPLNPKQVTDVEAALPGLEHQLPRRYSVGGNVLWLGWPDEADRGRLEGFLSEQTLSALALTGNWNKPQLGKQAGGYFMDKLRSVLDPEDKFTVQPEMTA